MGGFFESTVVLVLQHGAAEGTTGVILNHPMHDDAGALEGTRGEPLAQTLATAAVRLGGPVEMHSCLVGLAAQPFEGSEEALPGVHWGPVLGLEALPPDSGPAVFLGYSGWGPGQLAEELERGCWSVVSASSGLVLGAAQLGPATPGMRPGGEVDLQLPPDLGGFGDFGDFDGFAPLSALRDVWEDLHVRCGISLNARPETP
jgi:putative transcriptional regulator